MPRVVVYVDGFNLYYGLRRIPGTKWLNLEALCRALLDAEDELLAVKYFTARVRGTPSDPEAPQRQQVYFRALRTSPLVQAHLGSFVVRDQVMPLASPVESLVPEPTRARVLRTEEKGTDVALGAHLVADAFRGDIDTGVVISNDSDLCPPIQLVTAAGIPVGVINPQPRTPSRKMIEAASFYKELREGVLRACQFPDPLADSKGSISKPVAW